MGFFRHVLSYFYSELRASVNDPTASLEDWFKLIEVGGSTDAGITVSSDNAIKLSAVWRAISIYSSLIASLPIQLFKRIKDQTEQIYDHPGLNLLTIEPNQIMTPFIFKETIQSFPLTWGNGYAYIWREYGKPKELQILHPRGISIKTTKDKRQIFYDVIDFKNDIPSRNMLHIPGLGFDGIKGKSPIGVAAESIGSGLALQKFGNKFFSQGAKYSGFLLYPGQLTEKTKEGLKKVHSKDTKLEKSHSIKILEEGMKFQPLTIPPEQSQFLLSRKFSVTEIARWFGLPPHLLGDLERATYSNIESQGIEFLVYSLRAWLKRWESELDRKLLSESEKKDYFFKFNINALLRADSVRRGQFYNLMLEKGVFSINDVRRLENMNGIGSAGDKHLVQIARDDIGNIGKNGMPSKIKSEISDDAIYKIVDDIFNEKSQT